MSSCQYFYPRSPCGERLDKQLYINNLLMISIHALLAESDLYAALCTLIGWTFLSTLSLRRATAVDHSFGHGDLISIHALLAESDCRQLPRRPGYRHFYPRSPCGERRCPGLGFGYAVRISIHALLAESDRLPLRPRAQRDRISIHALLAESDGLYDTYAKVLRVFLSTLSLRRAT